MAVTDPYCDAATYRAIVSKSDTAKDAEILADLRAVSRLIDRRTGRFFGRDAVAVARVYRVPTGYASYRDADYLATLEVDDIATSAGFSVVDDADADGLFGEAAWAATDYELRPVNAGVGPEPAPYTRLAVPSWSTKTGSFGGAQRLQVTAVWGWPAVPDAIVRATAHLTGILRLESPRATSRVSEMGEVISTSRQARDIVDDLVTAYKRHAIVFA